MNRCTPCVKFRLQSRLVGNKTGPQVPVTRPLEGRVYGLRYAQRGREPGELGQPLPGFGPTLRNTAGIEGPALLQVQGAEGTTRRPEGCTPPPPSEPALIGAKGSHFICENCPPQSGGLFLRRQFQMPLLLLSLRSRLSDLGSPASPGSPPLTRPKQGINC